MPKQFDDPWIEVTRPSEDVRRIERLLVAERDAAEEMGLHPERIQAIDSLITCIRRGDYRRFEV